MSLFRAHAIPYDDMNALPVRTMCLAEYLNTIWKNLILKDDEYVNQVFGDIHRYLPDESPVCLMFKLMAIGEQVLSQPPVIGSATPQEERVPANQAYVDTLRNMLITMYKQRVQQLLEATASKKSIKHYCTGPKYTTLAETQDPDQPFFQVDVKTVQ